MNKVRASDGQIGANISKTRVWAPLLLSSCVHTAITCKARRGDSFPKEIHFGGFCLSVSHSSRLKNRSYANASLISFLGGASVKNWASAGDYETRVQALGGEDPLEKEMATHSSLLA